MLRPPEWYDWLIAAFILACLVLIPLAYWAAAGEMRKRGAGRLNLAHGFIPVLVWFLYTRWQTGANAKAAVRRTRLAMWLTILLVSLWIAGPMLWRGVLFSLPPTDSLGDAFIFFWIWIIAIAGAISAYRLVKEFREK